MNDYDQKLFEARQIEKLIDSNAWAVYQGLIDSEVELCVRKIETSPCDQLQVLQGALIMARKIKKLPERFIEDAKKRREEKQEEVSND